MCGTPDYACENAHEAPGKNTKEISFLYFLIYLLLTLVLAIKKSITVFIFWRELHDTCGEQGRCTKVYPANLLVYEMKSCHLGEQREVTEEPHAKRGACAREKKN